MKNLLSASITILSIVFFLGTANANLITNGTFDSDPNTDTNWSIYNGVVDWISPGIAEVGKQNTAFGQDFFIPTGTSAVHISFDYAWFWSDLDPNQANIFSVYFSYSDPDDWWTITKLLEEDHTNGVSQATTTFFDQVFYLPSLKGTGPNGNISFVLQEPSTNGGSKIQLYNVDVNPVPEPATMMLFGIGLLGIAGMNRRRK